MREAISSAICRGERRSTGASRSATVVAKSPCEASPGRSSATSGATPSASEAAAPAIGADDAGDEIGHGVKGTGHRSAGDPSLHTRPPCWSCWSRSRPRSSSLSRASRLRSVAGLAVLAIAAYAGTAVRSRHRAAAHRAAGRASRCWRPTCCGSAAPPATGGRARRAGSSWRGRAARRARRGRAGAAASAGLARAAPPPAASSAGAIPRRPADDRAVRCGGRSSSARSSQPRGPRES